MHELGKRMGRLSVAIERLARWWTSASQAERFTLCQASIRGDPAAPTFSELQVAIFLAEAETGQIDQR